MCFTVFCLGPLGAFSVSLLVISYTWCFMSKLYCVLSSNVLDIPLLVIHLWLSLPGETTI